VLTVNWQWNLIGFIMSDKMKQCKVYGKAVSTKAQTCPHCFVADPAPKLIVSEIGLLGMVLFGATVSVITMISKSCQS
jgi:hypothetical protein|tara:strand:+ start:338 stop:571 length:234 start_codon:yes stop_codon:yes gene_type:complete